MQIPLQLEQSSNILVAGAGGGFDVVCGLPVAIWLKTQGHNVHLANYSFSLLKGSGSQSRAIPGSYEVNAQTPSPEGGYFPEGYLAQWWLKEFGENLTVWCYQDQGVKPLARIFAQLCQHLKLDAIILVDAGVDGLFEGTEYDVGTPSIDIISILAAYQIDHIERLYISTAFGTEGRNHVVRHADALMRMSQQVALGGLVDVTAVAPQTRVGQLFLDATEYIHDRQGFQQTSNMASSLVAALKGKFGHHDLTSKTTEAPIWVSPLTLLYWIFKLETVAQAKPFLNKALESETVGEMVELVKETRERYPTMPRLDIPI